MMRCRRLSFISKFDRSTRKKVRLFIRKVSKRFSHAVLCCIRDQTGAAQGTKLAVVLDVEASFLDLLTNLDKTHLLELFGRWRFFRERRYDAAGVSLLLMNDADDAKPPHVALGLGKRVIIAHRDFTHTALGRLIIIVRERLIVIIFGGKGPDLATDHFERLNEQSFRQRVGDQLLAKPVRIKSVR
jgi:hypothetical protein